MAETTDSSTKTQVIICDHYTDYVRLFRCKPHTPTVSRRWMNVFLATCYGFCWSHLSPCHELCDFAFPGRQWKKAMWRRVKSYLGRKDCSRVCWPKYQNILHDMWPLHRWCSWFLTHVSSLSSKHLICVLIAQTWIKHTFFWSLSAVLFSI